MLKFLKMQALGNDFIILDFRNADDNDRRALEPAHLKEIYDRRTGVGCDQLVALESSQNADLFMGIYNADGSETGACGNVTRCVADLYMSQSGTDNCTIETKSGVLVCNHISDKMVEVDMGSPKLEWSDIPLLKETDTLHLGIERGSVSDPVAVSMGNPHCIFFVDSVEDIPVEELGPVFENHPLFPERANIGFAQILSPERLRLRTWERGAGLTPSCGSSSCASVVAAVRRDLTSRKVEVITDGGSLNIEWRESDNHVLMSGPVTYVFDGMLANPL